MGEQRRRVPQPLSEEAWAPFGWVPVPDTDPADGTQRLEYEWDDVHVNIIGHTLDEVPHTATELSCEQLYRHRTHTQVLMPIDHPCVIAVAPPGTDFATEGTDAPVAAFLLQPLQSLVLHRGTWHWGPYPTHSDEVRLFNVQGLRYAEDNEMVDLAALGLTVVVDRS
jgi:ureidoglycolate hydrolase